MQLNKEDRNVYITHAYKNSSGSNENDTGIMKDMLLEHWSNIIIGSISIKACIANDGATTNVKKRSKCRCES